MKKYIKNFIFILLEITIITLVLTLLNYFNILPTSIYSYLELINQSVDIPFEISDNTTALEETRLKYRYLDLRRETLKNIL